MTQAYPICKDKRECFAKEGGKTKRCAVLNKTYEDGKCPFCKPIKKWRR